MINYLVGVFSRWTSVGVVGKGKCMYVYMYVCMYVCMYVYSFVNVL